MSHQYWAPSYGQATGWYQSLQHSTLWWTWRTQQVTQVGGSSPR
jgi:hypothetical protein